MLRANTEDDIVVSPRPGDFRLRSGQRNSLVADCNRQSIVALRHVRREQVDLGRPDERRDEHVRRGVVELVAVADLLHATVIHDEDPVAERDRLHLVVRDVDRRGLELAVQVRELDAHLRPQLRIEVRERLVEQEDLRLADDRRAPARLAAAGHRSAGAAFAASRCSMRSIFAACMTRCSISAFGNLRFWRAKLMFSATVMCGYSA